MAPVINDFSQLDAQRADSALAKITPAELLSESGMTLEMAGWPGDGSGEDDLADVMAHGDEGCCDTGDAFELHEAEDSYLDASYEDRTDLDFYE
jgi:hypothetical protein